MSLVYQNRLIFIGLQPFKNINIRIIVLLKILINIFSFWRNNHIMASSIQGRTNKTMVIINMGGRKN